MNARIAAPLIAGIWMAGAAGLRAGDDAVYASTPPGRCEIKTLPALTSMSAASTNGYFGVENGLFRRLFRYIRDNDVAMSTPVEAEMAPGRMRFFRGSENTDPLEDAGEVKVERLPARTVASIGVRGGYTRENFEAAEADLRAWLKTKPEWQADGPARAAYWNSPFMPNFLKRSEVHLPVRPATAPAGG